MSPSVVDEVTDHAIGVLRIDSTRCPRETTGTASLRRRRSAAYSHDGTADAEHPARHEPVRVADHIAAARAGSRVPRSGCAVEPENSP